MSQLSAYGIPKAYLVDRIRELLRAAIRPIGLERLAREVNALVPDVRAALRYLDQRGEVEHDRHRGYRRLDPRELLFRRKAGSAS